MTLGNWIAVAALGLQGVINLVLLIEGYLHRRTDAADRERRLAEVEETLRIIEAKASGDAAKWQKGIGEMTERLARVETRQGMDREWGS